MISIAEPLVPLPDRERILALRDALGVGLIERGMPIRLVLLGALAGEHTCLLGPPGTAKSLLARRLRLAFRDATYFERLLTKFTVPEELFGPFSIRGLEEDRYERKIEGYLPTAQVGFIDEIFKSNAAILNALLTLVNEREYDNGTRRIRCPLITLVSASNELPDQQGNLGALWDRFLLRYEVGYVSDAGFGALLDPALDEEPAIDPTLPLSMEELAAFRAAARQVALSPEVRELFGKLRAFLAAERIPVSDRRWRKIVKVLQVAALADDRDTVTVWDAWLLQHMTWERPDQRAVLADWYARVIGGAGAGDPSQLLAEVGACEAKLARWAAAPRPSAPQAPPPASVRFIAPQGAMDVNHTPLVDLTNGGRGFSQAELRGLWIAYQGRFADFGSTSLFAAHLADRANRIGNGGPTAAPVAALPGNVQQALGTVVEIRARVEGHLAALSSQDARLVDEVGGHPFLDGAFVGDARAEIARQRGLVEPLLGRLVAVESGLSDLGRRP